MYDRRDATPGIVHPTAASRASLREWRRPRLWRHSPLTCPRPRAARRPIAWPPTAPTVVPPLVLRQNRQTGALFTGCSAYPGCAFTEPHDARVQTLSTGVVQAVQTLATQVGQAQAEARRHKLGQDILAISGEIRRPGLEGGLARVLGSPYASLSARLYYIM